MPKSDSLSTEFLRQKISALRKDLTPDQVASRSQTVCHRFIQFAEAHWKESDFDGRVIGMYSPFKSELDPAVLIKTQIFAHAFFAYPRIKSLADGTMDFAIPTHASDWVKGRLGILEPRAELPPVENSRFCLFIVPGVAFGRHGERVGMGAGFYDRFLYQHPKTLRIALAYDFQMLDEPFTQNSWDMKMDGVFGETQEFLANLG